MFELDSLDRIDVGTFDFPELLARPAMLFSGQLTEVYAEATADREEIHLIYLSSTPDELQPTLDEFNAHLTAHWMKLIFDVAAREVDAAKAAYERTRDAHGAKIKELRANAMQKVA